MSILGQTFNLTRKFKEWIGSFWFRTLENITDILWFRKREKIIFVVRFSSQPWSFFKIVDSMESGSEIGTCLSLDSFVRTLSENSANAVKDSIDESKYWCYHVWLISSWTFVSINSNYEIQRCCQYQDTSDRMIDELLQKHRNKLFAIVSNLFIQFHTWNTYIDCFRYNSACTKRK